MAREQLASGIEQEITMHKGDRGAKIIAFSDHRSGAGVLPDGKGELEQHGKIQVIKGALYLTAKNNILRVSLGEKTGSSDEAKKVELKKESAGGREVITADIEGGKQYEVRVASRRHRDSGGTGSAKTVLSEVKHSAGYQDIPGITYGLELLEAFDRSKHELKPDNKKANRYNSNFNIQTYPGTTQINLVIDRGQVPSSENILISFNNTERDKIIPRNNEHLHVDPALKQKLEADARKAIETYMPAINHKPTAPRIDPTYSIYGGPRIQK